MTSPITEAVYKSHQPFVWSINTGHKDALSDPRTSSRVLSYSISGNDKYAATLTLKGRSLQLDMWDLKPDLTATSGVINNAGTSMDAHNGRQAPFTPELCGQFRTLDLLSKAPNKSR